MCWALLDSIDVSLCEPLWCQNAGSERTDLAAELSLELHCGAALRFRHLHRWNQGIKLLRLALGHELHVCWALLDSIDTVPPMCCGTEKHTVASTNRTRPPRLRAARALKTCASSPPSQGASIWSSTRYLGEL